MPTYEEALAYLGYDSDDPMIQSNVVRALATARRILLGAVGADVLDYLPGDSRVKELVLIYLDDLISERGVSAKTASARRDLVQNMELQLRLELVAAREEAGE